MREIMRGERREMMKEREGDRKTGKFRCRKRELKIKEESTGRGDVTEGKQNGIK